MGLVSAVGSHPLAQQFQALGFAWQIAIALGGFLALSVMLNVANQVLNKNPLEPPLVFHWFPFVGSTITYGMDPPRFFQENRAKVGASPRVLVLLWMLNAPSSMAMSSPLSSSARRRLLPWARPETTSYSTAGSRTSTQRRSTPS